MSNAAIATPAPNANHLVTFRDDLDAFIFELAIGATDIDQPVAGKLQRILAVFKAELQRRVSCDVGSAEHLETVTVVNLVGLLLMQHFLEARITKLRDRVAPTPDENRMCRFLIAALREFDFGRAEMYETLPAPKIRKRLAEKIWFNFYDVTADDCRRDADAIREMLGRTDEQPATSE